MSKPRDRSVYTSRIPYTDRAKQDNESFSDLVVKIQTIETALLLLNSEEESVLLAVFKHITDFVRKQPENIEGIKDKNLFEILLQKELFFSSENVIVKRYALYLATAIIESISTLHDLDTAKTFQIMDLCLRQYLTESDDFCIEYLSVIINKCLDDPQVARFILENQELLTKFFETTAKFENPDTVLHSIEALYKMLQIQNAESMQFFVADTRFPIDRVICDLTNEFPEIRSAALKVVKTLIVDAASESSPFAEVGRSVFVLQQLTKLLCDSTMSENAYEVVEVLATAMRSEKMAQIFFEQNLFDKITNNLEANTEVYTMEFKCRILNVFSEIAKYPQYLYRLHVANITELFLNCLLEEVPPTHVVAGLNRIMKFTESANSIIDAYPRGVVGKLLRLMHSNEVLIKTREQAADLLNNLLTYAYHNTASELMDLGVPNVLGEIFGQGLTELSIDFIISALAMIENLAQNNEYRFNLGQSMLLTQNMALLLKKSFSAAILVNNIFRCLCTLVDEEGVRNGLLSNYIAQSIKRGLKSLANLVKTSVTNFIMQTTRFPEFVHEYIDAGVLEVLIMHQKHAFCISTWNPAIESILSKCPTLKFCIRNHLGFTDTTVGNDFLVSKKKFDDFRVFQNILKEEVSPLHPILVVNFERPRSPTALVVHVVIEPDEVTPEACEWCYCRQPGDELLPRFLDILNQNLEEHGLMENPTKMQRDIDFDNIAKRAKLVAEVVADALGEGLKSLDLNTTEECSQHAVQCHLKDLACEMHSSFIPIGRVRSGCQFERAILFKCLADQIGLPCTLQRSVDGKLLFNEVPLPVEVDRDVHCDKKSMKFLPWRMLRPTHIVDLMYNVGDLYPMQSRQALQYLRLY